MIYFCADDYGLNETSSRRIEQCIDEGALNKVSVFANFDSFDLSEIQKNKSVRFSLHLNLVEGKCMANQDEVSLIADKNGNLRHTFGGLFKLWLLDRRNFESQVYKEIKAQILFWKKALPEGTPFCIDSHQHTHMIPAVFSTLVKVLREEKINVEYMRIPAEPISPFIKTPSLYFTYSPINLIKQWLLKLLWLINKKALKDFNIQTAYFFGILFSGKMDQKRVEKILPKYIELANKHKKDIEVLFHPGYLEANEISVQNKNIVFSDFYLSENRKTEFLTAMKMSERSV